MGTPRRNGSDDAEAILRTQLDFAQAMVGNIAKSTEAYQLMWGPFGGPAVGACGRRSKHNGCTLRS